AAFTVTDDPFTLSLNVTELLVPACSKTDPVAVTDPCTVIEPALTAVSVMLKTPPLNGLTRTTGLESLRYAEPLVEMDTFGALARRLVADEPIDPLPLDK